MADDRERLENEHAEAGSTFDTLRAQLRDRIGVCPQEEYQSLNRAVDETWNALQLARRQFDRRIRDMGDT